MTETFSRNFFGLNRLSIFLIFEIKLTFEPHCVGILLDHIKKLIEIGLEHLIFTLEAY